VRNDLVELCYGFPHAVLGELFALNHFTPRWPISPSTNMFSAEILGFVEASGPNDIASSYIHEIEHKGYRRGV
jgi:hypothetical protein